MTKQLTWFECSAQLNAGDRVRFVVAWDVYPHCVIPADTLGTVIENDLNELDCGLFVLPDSRQARHHLAEWQGEAVLGLHLDPGADGEVDAEWQSLSPLALA